MLLLANSNTLTFIAKVVLRFPTCLYHCHLIHSTESLSRMYQCWLCHQYARKTLNGILRHIREVHTHFEGRVMCGINGCLLLPLPTKVCGITCTKASGQLKPELPPDHRPQVTTVNSGGPPADVFSSSDNQGELSLKCAASAACKYSDWCINYNVPAPNPNYGIHFCIHVAPQ